MGFGVRLLQASAGLLVAAIVTGNTVFWWSFAGTFTTMIIRFCYLNNTSIANPPKSTPVPSGKLRICVAGYTHSGPTAKAHYLADLVAKTYPDKYETWYYFDQYSYFDFLKKKFDPVPFPPHLKGHATSPFVWFETGADNKIQPIGGSDHLSEWAIKQFPGNEKIVSLAKENWLSIVPYITGRSFHCDEGKPLPPATCASK